MTEEPTNRGRIVKEDFSTNASPSVSSTASGDNPFSHPQATSDSFGAPEASFSNPYAAPESPCELILGKEETIRHKYLKHEESVKSVGSLMLLGGVGILLLAFFLTLASIALLSERPNEGTRMLVFSIAFLGYGVFQTLLGIDLRNLKDWARIGAGILSMIGLLAIPIGTIISLYFLYVLFSPKGAYVCTPAYREVIDATPHIRYRISGFLIALVIVFVLTAALMIGIRV